MSLIRIAASLVLIGTLAACNSAPLVTSAAPKADSEERLAVGDKAASDLPPLPVGWTFKIRPSAPGETFRSESSITGDMSFMTKYAAMDAESAVGNGWQTTVREIAASVKNSKDRYDVELKSPPNQSGKEFRRVFRTELQRAYGFRATTETRKMPVVILKAPGGKPSIFHPAATADGGFNTRRINEMKAITMASFAEVAGANRNMKVIDETGIDGTFDVTVPDKYWTDDALRGMGFDVVHEEHDVEVLVVTPAKP
ncbi:hypothetical protein BH09SUM1_BH09SUM1_33160 [soil metagenome]